MAQRAAIEPVRVNRIPPHNLDAEQSVLGAMLESKEAIANVVEILEADDFYKPAHATTYETILSLYARGDPVDAITLAEELARRGDLEKIGGKPYIHGLLEAYPTASSAGRYARIVADHAVLRRLVDAGNKVQEIGFSIPEDVSEAVDQAEGLVYEVGNRRLREDVQPIRRLLTENMDAIAALYDRGESVTGVASGFEDLDDMTAGFQPSNLVIVAARPSMGKCLSGGTFIDDPLTGDRRTIEEFIQLKRREILGIDRQGSIRTCRVGEWIPNGVGGCWRLTTRTGRSVEATSNHPFLTVEGWVPLRSLAVGQKIAVPRALRVFGREPGWSTERVRLLGYYIAEGGLSSTVARFTNTDQGILADFHTAADKEFPDCSVRVDRAALVARAKKRSTKPNSIVLWLRSLGLMGKKSVEKRLPACVWRFSRQHLAELLKALFSCDATVYSMQGYPRIELTVASEGLAKDVQHALLRFGIIAKLWQKDAKFDGRVFRAWRLEVTEPASVDIYQSQIGWIGEKAARTFRQLDRRRRSNCGHLPVEVWPFVRKALAAKGMSLAELARRSGESFTNIHASRGLPQHRLAKYAEILDDDDLRYLASEDLYWDEIAGIEYVGEKPVYDLTVPEASNFVAADICVHNSALLGDFALHAARRNYPTVIFSLEMSRNELVQRFLASESRVDFQRIRKGALQEQDWARLSAALGRLAEAPIFIDDSANVTLMEMRAKCRRLKARHGLGLVLIDYLQLMQGPIKSENRQQEVSEISRSLKILARDLKVPVVCASQLNRAVEYRADKRPLLADLRESGSIEQDSDLVMFLYRDEIYNPDTDRKGEAELILAKHRNGPTGIVRLAFMNQYTKFASIAKGLT